MAKVIITVSDGEDADGDRLVSIEVEFDPPLDAEERGEEEASGAQLAAVKMLQAFSTSECEWEKN